MTSPLSVGGALVLAMSALAACYTGPSIDEPAPGPAGGGPGTAAQGPIASDLPCDVAKVLADSCVGCHGTPLSGGAPRRLVTFDDLAAPSASDPSSREVDLSIARMKDAKRPMPPSGLLPASDLSILERWVAAGLPKGTCASAATSLETPSTCTSQQTWRHGEGATMAPGQACITCHSQGEGPRFAFAGTVYPTAHEPDDCLGVNGTTGVTVVITGADGATATAAVNRSGNFSIRGGLAMPYTAKVVANGKVRGMMTPQTNGDCNSCHSELGSNKAPGRVMAP